MKIIKVDAIPSTNSFLKEVLRNKSITNPTCVWAKTQTDGKGQRGTTWVTEAGKNLTFSAFFFVNEEIGRAAFVLNMLTALTVKNVLEKYNLPQLRIKWPNDILSVNKKIGGILIESSYQNGVLSETVIGIGLNVNQEDFSNLPKASSVKNILGISLSLEELLMQILASLEEFLENYTSKDFIKVKQNFENAMFRYKKPSTFVVQDKEFVGIIQGVTDNGLLLVLEEDDCINTYDLKQIELKY
ncbi:biotin--[acetyl-CoA-carboxylase] ligase [Aquimarina agarilytica]|uniref:biotin--[acetyl-CoA-carboxylase] ligase n=1 Tax=Aquimarina agarilytica TaxID=1087449 RepID=UPI0002895478|nr:biotin--[acetyl-CoA-carboxylase] ligase [Aquimarina agarilytica]